VTEQGWVSNFSAVWQVASTLAIVACLLALPSQRNSSEWVWTTVMNRTGYPQASTPYVCMLGLLLSTFTLSGYDAGARMSEETTHASKVRIIYVPPLFTRARVLLGCAATRSLPPQIRRHPWASYGRVWRRRSRA
jgi:hypothetical protein